MASEYITSFGNIPVDLSQRESDQVAIRMRVMMRLNRLVNSSRLDWKDQCSIAYLIGVLKLAYGIGCNTELDAHLRDPETHDARATPIAGERLSD